MGYDQEMAREFIAYCAMWARAFNVAAEAADEELVDIGDNEKAQAFRLRLASGHKIVGLPSVARALRGRQGLVIMDEAAFHSDLEEALKAALALLMWGGQVVVVSTHDGVDNPFNKLLNEIRSEERKGETATITFDDAIADGLYERIALTGRNRGMSKAEWIADVRETYGDNAKEELDCIPSRGSGAWLSYDEIERAEDPTIPIRRLAYDDAFAALPDHVRQAAMAEWCETQLLPVLLTFGAHEAFGVGMDFARSSDLSVIWLLSETQARSCQSRLVIEMRNVPFREQEWLVAYVLRRLRRWRFVPDAGGNGSYLAERMVQTFGASRVEALLAREPSWREQGPPIKQKFEDGRITIPRDADIASDLRAVKVEGGVPTIPKARTNAKGEDAAMSKAKGKAKRHADAAVALVNAHYALRTGVGSEIDFQSAPSSTGASTADYDLEHGFGVVSSELQMERY